jgi:branched-chain amino acid transport system ATP-binding protein
MAIILEAVGLTRSFGKVTVADNLHVQIEAGQRVGIVGPNGAGKTSFLNIITGYIKPEQGQILYRGQNITGHSPRAITQMGIARSFQIPQLYTSLTVQENLLIALAAQAGHGLHFWHSIRHSERLAEAATILEQFGLGAYTQRPVAELPEGSRKLLDIALSFALKPWLLLMDEPTSGVSMNDKFGVMDTLVEVLQKSGVTTIFVEHDMEVVLRYASRMLVFNNGHVEADGDPQTLYTNPQVRQAMGWESC